MTACLWRRRGGLLYLLASCSLLAFCFISSVLRPASQSGGHDAYPWQMIGYDDYGCGCPRSGPPIVRESTQSLCSDWSTSRGMGQKVVSYSLFGDLNKTLVYNKYFRQFEDRLKEVKQHYEGWLVRLYHNLSLSDSTSRKYLCGLYCQYPHLDLCQVNDLYPPQAQVKPGDTQKDERGHDNIGERKLTRVAGSSDSNVPVSYGKKLVGRMWRFVVMADPLVTEFLIRDTDSTILPREVAAVQQWLQNSTALLHVMRDHPNHNGVILAGLWGGSRARGGDLLKELLAKMARWPRRELWDYDQVLLKREVWPEVLDDVLVHDSYFCGNPHFRSHHRAAPFPTQRNERYFVGWGPLRDHELQGILPCPHVCRPTTHQDWTYC